MSKKKIIIPLVILAVLAGIFCYFWFSWLMPKWEAYKLNPNPYTPTYPAPVLFSKEDYQIDHQPDGTYIVIDKVGLTAKVPEGWTVKQQESSSYPENQYWLELNSSNQEFNSVLLVKGCMITISGGFEKQNNEEVKNQIALINANPQQINEFKEGYKYEIYKIGNKKVLKWLSPEKELIGQGTGIDVPINNNDFISLNMLIPIGWKETCEPIWNNFLKTIEIK